MSLLTSAATALEARPRFGDVAGDLGLQLVEGSELALVAKLADEGDFQFVTVELAAEIEQVNFDAGLRCRLVHGGADADVQDRAVRRTGVAPVSNFLFRLGEGLI